jgi:N-acetylmuramoyl-L-alanine amidase
MAEEHVIQPGDCVLLIAQERGFFWQTLWQHPKNESLAQRRKDPNVVLAGDVLHIPDPELKYESGGTETKHKFRVKGVPIGLKLKLTKSAMDCKAPERTAAGPGEYIESPPQKPKSEPDADVPYALYVDSVLVKEGKTDSEGCISAALPPKPKEGRLVLHPGEGVRERTILLNLGHMDPIEETAGVCKRLNNLGYPCPEEADEDSTDLAGALQAFQRDHNLQESGRPDDATRDRLKQFHGG